MAKLLSVLVLLTTLSYAGAGAAAPRVQPGEWETKLTGPSVPAPMVTKYCITPAEATAMSGDLATLKRYVEDSTAERTKGRCFAKSVALNGDRTVVTIVCGKTEVTATTTYHGDRYESSDSNGTKVTGKRTGACPAR